MFSSFVDLVLAVAIFDVCLSYVIKEEKAGRFAVDKRIICDQCYVGDDTCANPSYVRQALRDVDEDGSCLRCAQTKCSSLAAQNVNPRVLSDCWARSWYRGCSRVCGSIPNSFLQRESACRGCLRDCTIVSGVQDYEIADIRTCVRTCIQDGTCLTKANFFMTIEPLMSTNCGMCISGLCQNTFSSYGIMPSVTCYNNGVEKCGDCENLSSEYDMSNCGKCLQGCKSAIKNIKNDKRKDNKEFANTRASVEMSAEGSSML